MAITAEGEIWFLKEGRMKEVAMLAGCSVNTHATETNCLVLGPYRQRDILIRFESAEDFTAWQERLNQFASIPVGVEAGPEDAVLSKFGRLKKTLASKASGTGAGRKVILSAFGEEGLGVVEALTGFAEEIDCHETADMVMINGLRLAVKIGVLLDSRVLRPDQFRCLLPLADEAVPFFSADKFTFAPSIPPKQARANAPQHQAVVGEHSSASRDPRFSFSSCGCL